METENEPMRHAPLIAGRYEPLQLLGAGGMGEVYLADDHLLSRQVALKRLKKHLAEDADALARFRKEALAAASLSHPNIVRVFDAGEGEPGDVPYIAMEHVSEGTVAHLLAREGRLRPSEAARIAAKIALALHEAHGKGIVHRDVKPQNVLLDEGGEPKVTDFGIALAATSASAALTRTAMIVGTARYLSPEQAQGDVATEKSDLYSLGVVLYEMLTGRVPFDADNPVALALKHVTEHPQSPRELAPRVAPAIEAATLGLLSKRPAERPRNAAVAARMLFDAAARADAPSAGSEPTARIASARDSRLARRRRRGLAVAGVMCAGLLAVPAALAQPVFVQEAYSGWFGEDAQPSAGSPRRPSAPENSRHPFPRRKPPNRRTHRRPPRTPCKSNPLHRNPNLPRPTPLRSPMSRRPSTRPRRRRRPAKHRRRRPLPRRRNRSPSSRRLPPSSSPPPVPPTTPRLPRRSRDKRPNRRPRPSG